MKLGFFSSLICTSAVGVMLAGCASNVAVSDSVNLEFVQKTFDYEHAKKFYVSSLEFKEDSNQNGGNVVVSSNVKDGGDGDVTITGNVGSVLSSGDYEKIDKRLAILSIPYLFEGYNVAKKVCDDFLLSYVDTILNEHGYKALALINFGYKNMLSNHNIYSEDQIDNLKVLSVNPNYVDKYVPLEFVEVSPNEFNDRIAKLAPKYSYHNADIYLMDSRLRRYYRNYIVFDNVMDLRPVVISKSYYDSLSSAAQKALTDIFLQIQSQSFEFLILNAVRYRDELSSKFNMMSFRSEIDFNDDLVEKLQEILDPEELGSLMFEINRVRFVNEFKKIRSSKHGSRARSRSRGGPPGGSGGPSGGPGGGRGGPR